MSSRQWGGVVLFPALVMLSGCGMNLSLLPVDDEPSRTELSEWQYHELLDQPQKAMPKTIAASLPDDHVADAARFLTRTLETAPDGVERQWHSTDKTTVLSIQPVSTTVNGQVVCRQAVLNLETADAKQEAGLHACRSDNGIWKR